MREIQDIEARFEADGESVGRLWAEYKSHPKLMRSVQDDEYTLAFRPT